MSFYKQDFINILLNIFFFIIIFFLTRQLPFSSYSYLMNISLCFFILTACFYYEKVNLSSPYAISFCLSLLLLSCLTIYSVGCSNSPALAIKFYIALTVLLIAYFMPANKTYINIFLLLNIIQSLVIISIGIYAIIFLNQVTCLPIRSKLQSMHWGDIYTYNGYFWYIKIKGSGLLPVSFYVSIIYLKNRTRIISAVIILTACMLGNTAFIISILFFLLFYYFVNTRYTKRKLIVALLISLVLLPSVLTMSFVSIPNLLKSKDSSMGARYDQIHVLLDDSQNSVRTLLLGTGLGHTVPIETTLRNYRDSIYYEVQSAYILNQMGLIFFSLYIVLHIAYSIKYIKRRELLLVYFCYVLYASSNPYIFDTNHFVVIVLLLALKKVRDEKENIFSDGGVQPGTVTV